jgi:peptide/nickel transport system ATP-binding protein
MSKQELHESQTKTRLLTIDSLSVGYETDEGVVHALRNISLELEAGEILGIAGESGSGKSTLALSVLRYLGANGRVTGGDMQFNGESLLNLSNAELADLRGNKISHVPQNPQRALNPALTVGEQIRETIERHQDCSPETARQRTLEMLADVEIPDPTAVFSQYPHQLSGGMQQRIVIGIGLSCDPDLLVLDEPTTGLDVTTEAKILSLVEDLISTSDTGVLLITHDIGVISEVADRLAVLYAGSLMESGPIDDVLDGPAHPYTVGLLNAVPRPDTEDPPVPIPGSLPDLVDVPEGCIFADRCEYATDTCHSSHIPLENINSESGHQAACLEWKTVQSATNDEKLNKRGSEESVGNKSLIQAQGLKKHYDEPSVIDSLFGSPATAKAVDGVSLNIRAGETVALVGESGCGKSTLGRTLLELLPRTDGSIDYRGTDIETLREEAGETFHAECRIVFQDPESSLNPKKTVRESVERPLELFTDLDKVARRERVIEILGEVGLGEGFAGRYPRELSGGEKQRVAIARAFVSNPSFVVLDEPVSALDVSIQAGILDLLESLQEQYDTSYLFISHDLSVVRHISDRVLVMYLGQIVERGSNAEVFSPPFHPYTRVLLSSVPSIDPSTNTDPIKLEGDVPSPRDPPTGCSFHPRCPQKIGSECEECEPELTERSSGTHISCHLDDSDLSDRTQ